jgi:hypothetical protein
MKRLMLFVMVLAVLAMGAWAEEKPLFKIGGVTDGYIIASKDAGKAKGGQDINIDIGPFFLDLTGDWTHTFYTGTDVLDLTYAVGYSQAFGIFTPGIKLTGDHSYALQTKVWTGDWVSDLTPTLDIAYKAFGINAYADLSFEKDYDLLQTVDVSAFFKFKLGTVRVGGLYANKQAVTDDVGHPNAPAIYEGYSLYAKASLSY